MVPTFVIEELLVDYDCTLAQAGCQLSLPFSVIPILRRSTQSSIAGLAIRRFELIELRVALAGEFSFRSFAVEIGSRTVVEGGVQIDPNLCIRVPVVLRGWRGLGQS